MSRELYCRVMHRCYYCSNISFCNERCECVKFGNETFCNDGCQEDYITEFQYKSMLFNNVIPCDLHVYFDLETTGLDSSRNEIIELGATVDPLWLSKSGKLHLIKYLDDEKEKEKLSFNKLIEPRKGLNEDAMRVNGITQQMIDSDAIPLEKAVTEFFDWIKGMITQEPAVVYLTGYNAHGFDAEFLRKAILKSKVKPPDAIHFAVCDSMKAVKELTYKPFVKQSMKLENVYNRMVKPENLKVQTHRALDDAMMQIAIAESLTMEQRKRYYETLRQSSRIIEFFDSDNKDDKMGEKRKKSIVLVHMEKKSEIVAEETNENATSDSRKKRK